MAKRVYKVCWMLKENMKGHFFTAGPLSPLSPFSPLGPGRPCNKHIFLQFQRRKVWTQYTPKRSEFKAERKSETNWKWNAEGFLPLDPASPWDLTDLVDPSMRAKAKTKTVLNFLSPRPCVFLDFYIVVLVFVHTGDLHFYMYLLCIWQMLLSRVSYNALKI